MFTPSSYTAIAVLMFAFSLMWRHRTSRTKATKINDIPETEALSLIKHRHEIINAYSDLIEKDGAGSWPPRAKHYSWSHALSPYHDIYLELAPLLSTEQVSLDDGYNTERINDFRSRMRKLLKERIDVAEVREILTAVEAGNWNLIDREAYNGFYSCIAACRHAYR